MVYLLEFAFQRPITKIKLDVTCGYNYNKKVNILLQKGILFSNT